MFIGTNCLVCIKNALVLGKVIAIYQYNVVVEIYGDEITEPITVEREDIISSVSSEAFEAIKDNYELLVKKDFQ